MITAYTCMLPRIRHWSYQLLYDLVGSDLGSSHYGVNKDGTLKHSPFIYQVPFEPCSVVDEVK